MDLADILTSAPAACLPRPMALTERLLACLARGRQSLAGNLLPTAPQA